jgi:hypothetical protein
MSTLSVTDPLPNVESVHKTEAVIRQTNANSSATSLNGNLSKDDVTLCTIRNVLDCDVDSSRVVLRQTRDP